MDNFKLKFDIHDIFFYEKLFIQIIVYNLFIY